MVDEFRDSKHFAWGPFIKRETTNAMVSLRKRHEGTITVLNTMNWMFFSNNESPMRFDDFDRRNFLVATTNDPSWTERVRTFHECLDAHPDSAKELAAGFAYILSTIQVDRALISRAPETALRAENRQFNKNAVQCWLADDAEYPRDKWIATSELYGFYKTWRCENAEDSAIRNQNAFSRHLGVIARKSGGAVKRHTDGYRVSWHIDGATYPRPPDDAAVKPRVTAAQVVEAYRTRNDRGA